MGCEIIHETIIRDITDVISDIKDSDYLEGIQNKRGSFKSIASASSNLTLVFPIICSKNVSIDNATMTTKAIERKAVSMLQMLFSALSITDSKDALDYVSKFHTNLKIDDDITIDGFIDALDKFVISKESAIVDKDLYDKVKRDLRNLNYTLPESISESGLNTYKVYPQTVFGSTNIVNEDSRDVKNTVDVLKIGQDMFRTQLLDSDVKKANEFLPSMMVINFISTNSSVPINAQAVIGVKAKLYPIDSADMINRIIVKNKDNNGFLKFVRATTREISFTRDFLFAIDKARIDALSTSKKGSSSKLWKILERRALKSKIRRTLGQVNDASAITTLVISQEEVEYIKKTENVDIENPKVIRPIMESYNFMSVCILDQTMEVAKFIMDTGSDVYEHVSFSQLERESGDGSYRKIINLMTKVAR